MFTVLTLVAASLAPQAADPSAIVEEAYSTGTEAVELCGFSESHFADFEAALSRDDAFSEENSNAEYRVFVSREPPFRILAIARPRETAFPMVYCREFLDNADGTSRLATDMHCEGERADCDAEFLAFYEHDQAILRSLER